MPKHASTTTTSKWYRSLLVVLVVLFAAGCTGDDAVDTDGGAGDSSDAVDNDTNTSTPGAVDDDAADSTDDAGALGKVFDTFARLEQDVPFQSLADQLGYSSSSAARRAFYSAQAQLVIRLRQREGGTPS